jgi:hypothetical protein
MCRQEKAVVFVPVSLSLSISLSIGETDHAVISSLHVDTETRCLLSRIVYPLLISWSLLLVPIRYVKYTDTHFRFSLSFVKVPK